jgi:DNA-binding transcriptional ArsR family regulator
LHPPLDIDDPRYVRALSHPLRVRILALLEERAASPVELARWLDATVGTVAYHVRTLRALGLIELVAETRVRGGLAHHYRAKPALRVSAEDWDDAGPVAKQASVGAELDTIAGYARAAAATGGFDRASAHLARTAMRLDVEGWEEASRACQELIERLGLIAASARERLASDGRAVAAMEASLVLLLFERVRLTDSTGSQLSTNAEKTTG